MKGRSIVENILQRQEIIRDINKRNEYHDVVVKLYMTEAYDRVLGIFLIQVMRRFFFMRGYLYGVEINIYLLVLLVN